MTTNQYNTSYSSLVFSDDVKKELHNSHKRLSDVSERLSDVNASVCVAKVNSDTSTNCISDTLGDVCKQLNKLNDEFEEIKMKNKTEKTTNIKFTKGIMSEIETYNIIVPNKVVEVIFEDGTVEKTVCHKEDNFNIETMIMVAMLKKLLGSAGNFNNYVKRAVRTWDKERESELNAYLEAERIKKKREKREEKRKARIERRKAERAEIERLAKEAEIEEKIKIQTEAIIRASQHIKKEEPDLFKKAILNLLGK